MKRKTEKTSSTELDAKPLVQKIANAEDEATGNAYEVFEFAKVLHRRGQVRIERDDAGDADKLAKILINKNADLPANRVAIAIKNAIAEPAPRFRLHASHLGWRDSLRAFVFHDGVAGKGKQSFELAPPLWLNDRQQGSLTEAGTVEEWIKRIAKPSMYSSRLMLTLSAAFAAPLVRVSGLQPFGFNLFGPSKVGKTTALLVATSVLGFRRESDMPNWNATSASFQETARVFNDLLLAVNEVGLLAGRRGDAYPKIRELTYVLAEGRDRGRHSGSQFASAATSATWHGIFVSTAEFSFSEYAARSGESRAPGEYARCLDVPAVVKQRPTIFDRRPRKVTVERHGKWAVEKLITIRGACQDQSGTAIKKYIRFLIKNRSSVAADIATFIKEFERTVDASTLDGSLRHAAKNFGLIYAGGRVAMNAGLLPWKKRRLLAAIASCFKGAVKDSIGHENAQTVAVRKLRQRLKSEKLVQWTAAAKFGPKKTPAFIEQKDGKTIVTVSSKEFRKWFDNDAQVGAIVTWLHGEGLLHPRNSRTPSHSRKGLEWATRDVRWPNGRNPGAFVFSHPF